MHADIAEAVAMRTLLSRQASLSKKGSIRQNGHDCFFALC
jgi:hypothetical protein